MLDFRRTDPDGKGTYRAVSARMRITAGDCHPGQTGTLLRTHDVHDPLTPITNAEQLNAQTLAIALQGIELFARYGIGDVMDILGRYVVISHREGSSDPPRLAPRQPQTLKRLGRGHLVGQMAIHVNQTRAIV